MAHILFQCGPLAEVHVSDEPGPAREVHAVSKFGRLDQLSQVVSPLPAGRVTMGPSGNRHTLPAETQTFAPAWGAGHPPRLSISSQVGIRLPPDANRRSTVVQRNR